jgi:hypothetical protein
MAIFREVLYEGYIAEMSKLMYQYKILSFKIYGIKMAKYKLHI